MSLQGGGQVPHGFTESLYAWTSMANTNGSALAGFGGTTFTLLVGMILLTSGLMVLPALSLGPIVEGLPH